jgi:hypothetical protein
MLGLSVERPASCHGGCDGSFCGNGVPRPALYWPMDAASRLAWSLRRRSINGQRGWPGAASMHADDTVDKEKRQCRLASTHVGEDGSTRGGCHVGQGRTRKRRARTRAWTARMSALTQFSPTFGPGMSQSSPACLFGSGLSWRGFYPFFVRSDAFGRALSI